MMGKTGKLCPGEVAELGMKNLGDVKDQSDSGSLSSVEKKNTKNS